MQNECILMFQTGAPSPILMMMDSGGTRFFSKPILGCSPRPRNRPGGSMRKLASRSLKQSIRSHSKQINMWQMSLTCVHQAWHSRASQRSISQPLFEPEIQIDDQITIERMCNSIILYLLIFFGRCFLGLRSCFKERLSKGWTLMLNAIARLWWTCMIVKSQSFKSLIRARSSEVITYRHGVNKQNAVYTTGGTSRQHWKKFLLKMSFFT